MVDDLVDKLILIALQDLDSLKVWHLDKLDQVFMDPELLEDQKVCKKFVPLKSLNSLCCENSFQDLKYL